MPAIVCKCGEILRYGEIPNPIEWLTINDVEYDSFTGTIDAEVLYRQMKSFLKCPVCHRLWFFWDGFNGDASEYISAEQNEHALQDRREPAGMSSNGRDEKATDIEDTALRS